MAHFKNNIEPRIKQFSQHHRNKKVTHFPYLTLNLLENCLSMQEDLMALCNCLFSRAFFNRKQFLLCVIFSIKTSSNNWREGLSRTQLSVEWWNYSNKVITMTHCKIIHLFSQKFSQLIKLNFMTCKRRVWVKIIISIHHFLRRFHHVRRNKGWMKVWTTKSCWKKLNYFWTS